MSRRATDILSTVAVMLVLLGLAWERWQRADMRRPLEHDEIISLEAYTWVGLTSTGEGRSLRRAEDLDSLERPTPFQCVMGAYRSLGVWKEPNNHVWNSLLMNLATAIGGPSTAIARLPALLGALAFGLAMFWLCHFVLEWRWAALPVAVWSFCCPYIIDFGLSARGYSWMLAFQPLLLGICYRLAARPGSLAWGGAAVVVCILSFINVVNTALDWLFPVYLAMWCFSPQPDPEARRTLRKSLLVQAFCLGLVGLVFLIDRLPFVYSSSRLYGLYVTPAGLPAAVAKVCVFLFPNWPWAVLGLIGVAGLAATLREPRYRLLGTVLAFTVLVNMVHFALAGRAPYPRGWGYYLPLVLIGTAYLLESAARRVKRPAIRSALGVLVFASTIALLATSLPRASEADPRAAATREMVAALEPTNRQNGYAVLPPVVSSLMRRYVPSGWTDPQDEIPLGKDLTLFFFAEKGTHPQVRMSVGTFWEKVLVAAPGTPLANSADERFCLTSVPARTRRFEPGEVLPSPVVFVVWYPDRNRIGLGARDILEFLDGRRIPYNREDVRVFAKLDFFTELLALEFLGATPAEIDKITSVMEEGIKRFGGQAILFTPRDVVPAAQP